MRKERVFLVKLGDGGSSRVKAHYLTTDLIYGMRFWYKPHWYSPADCVGWFEQHKVKAVESEDGGQDWLKEIKVKL